MNKIFSIIIVLFLLSFESFAQHTIIIENKAEGEIAIVKDSGTKEVIGHVIYPTGRFNEKGYAASQWIPSSEVSATSVNAIHIKVDDAKTIFSVLPVEFETRSIASFGSYLSPDSSIYTDIKASEGIFGGGYAPFVGNPVTVNGAPLNKNIPLVSGDVIQIEVKTPDHYPRAMVFENKFAGKIKMVYPDGAEEVVAEVLRPVQGVGRFDGSLFLDPGRIRANHAGVIDVCTSTIGYLGGFQIVPADHASDLKYVMQKTQWMVISGTSLFDPPISGKEPFFKGFIKPDYLPQDMQSDNWYERLAVRYLVEVKLKGSDRWQAMPIYNMEQGEDLPESANTALEKVTQIRILFPASL